MSAQNLFAKALFLAVVVLLACLSTSVPAVDAIAVSYNSDTTTAAQSPISSTRHLRSDMAMATSGNTNTHEERTQMTELFDKLLSFLRPKEHNPYAKLPSKTLTDITEPVSRKSYLFYLLQNEEKDVLLKDKRFIRWVRDMKKKHPTSVKEKMLKVLNSYRDKEDNEVLIREGLRQEGFESLKLGNGEGIMSNAKLFKWMNAVETDGKIDNFDAHKVIMSFIKKRFPERPNVVKTIEEHLGSMH